MLACRTVSLIRGVGGRGNRRMGHRAFNGTRLPDLSPGNLFAPQWHLEIWYGLRLEPEGALPKALGDVTQVGMAESDNLGSHVFPQRVVPDRMKWGP